MTPRRSPIPAIHQWGQKPPDGKLITSRPGHPINTEGAAGWKPDADLAP
jgi:hypothetical protein